MKEAFHAMISRFGSNKIQKLIQTLSANEAAGIDAWLCFTNYGEGFKPLASREGFHFAQSQVSKSAA